MPNMTVKHDCLATRTCFTACFIGGAPLAVHIAVKARAVQTKKDMSWSDGYNYCLLQRGNGYYEDSEDSQSSQGTDSSKEVTEHLNPWSRILDEAEDRHEVQLNALVDEYKRNGDSENVSLLPLYRKELRKVLLEYLQWMRAKKDYTFQKVIETQKDTGGFDWLESTELAIDTEAEVLA